MTLLLVLGQLTALVSAAQIGRPTSPPGMSPVQKPSERPLLNTSKLASPPKPARPPDERVVVCEDGSTRTLRDAESRPAKCWPVNESTTTTTAVGGSPRATAPRSRR